jgi:hypothetical protein
MAIGARNKQIFAPLMAIDGTWSHALEIRFLLGHGAFRPPPSLSKLKKAKDKALLLRVPEKHVLILNLLVAATGAAGLPQIFAEGSLLWQARLSDGRIVTLVGRTPPFDDANTKQLRFIRAELNPNVTLDGLSTGAQS